MRNYRLLECLGLYLLAMLAAARGEQDAVAEVTDRMTMWASPSRAGLVSRIASQARLVDALGPGEYEQVYRHAMEIGPVGELASSPWFF